MPKKSYENPNPLMLTTSKVAFRQIVTVVLDETKFTPEFLAEFRASFYNFHTIDEHRAHLAQLYARGLVSATSFIEGYGDARLFGISFEIKTDYLDVESTEPVMEVGDIWTTQDRDEAEQLGFGIVNLKWNERTASIVSYRGETPHQLLVRLTRLPARWADDKKPPSPVTRNGYLGNSTVTKAITLLQTYGTENVRTLIALRMAKRELVLANWSKGLNSRGRKSKK